MLLVNMKVKKSARPRRVIRLRASAASPCAASDNGAEAGVDVQPAGRRSASVPATAFDAKLFEPEEEAPALARLPMVSLIAIALLLRHSWSLYDLSRTGHRIGLGCGPLQAELNTNGCDCARRRRRRLRPS
mgnify:CR=1 FL=1